MNRRQFIELGSLTALAAATPPAIAGAPSLIRLDIPSPRSLRGGWAAYAAVLASRGWGRDAYATADAWFFHDGGGNWACLRLKQKDQLVLLGHDHEYSETYFGEAAAYFEEPETDLLAGAPDWWSFNLDPQPYGEWVGFVYGWNGQAWQRAAYDADDGFESVGLLDACSVGGTKSLEQFVSDAPGHAAGISLDEPLRALVDADADITDALLEACVPGWDIAAGVAAGRRFLEMDLG